MGLGVVVEVGGEFLDCPARVGVAELVGLVAVLPDCVSEGGFGGMLEGGLGEEACEETGEEVAASALGEVGVAGAVDEDGAAVLADQSLMSL
ncbi:MAG: hypothetical protein RI897_89 [Verrucomicrobiota bacterium]